MVGSAPAPTGPALADLARGPAVCVVSAAGATVCERCYVADTAMSRLRGLLGRTGLPSGHGLWIRPATSIHMFFMRFAIDAVFVDRDGVVVKTAPALKPWRMAACRRARSVIELAEGEIELRRIKLGDRLEAVERNADLIAA